MGASSQRKLSCCRVCRLGFTVARRPWRVVLRPSQRLLVKKAGCKPTYTPRLRWGLCRRKTLQLPSLSLSLSFSLSLSLFFSRPHSKLTSGLFLFVSFQNRNRKKKHIGALCLSRQNSTMPSLLFGLSSLVLATTAIATAPVQDRQLHSLPPKQSSASSSSSLLPTTATSSSTTSSTPLSTTLATQTGGSARWELTTVFTQPTGCVGGITQYAGSLSTLDYWLNIPFPAPGVTSTSCFPQPLLASVTARDDLPPYENLVCPDQWGSFDYNSTYRICCPKYVL